MATPSEKLAKALVELQKIQKDKDIAVINAGGLNASQKNF